jgi:hypothetical protein
MYGNIIHDGEVRDGKTNMWYRINRIYDDGKQWEAL